MRTEKQLNKRDRKLLHAIRVKAEIAFQRAKFGHSDGWQPLRDALDKADDEMGPIEDFIP
jgi:hypothetical protein